MRKLNRRLTLRRETVAALEEGTLDQAAGGTTAPPLYTRAPLFCQPSGPLSACYPPIRV
jgi:hypothetical protein